MLREDLRLLFDTEKQMLRRRLASLFATTPTSEKTRRRLDSKRQRATRIHRVQPSRPRSPSRRILSVDIANWAISIVLHLVLLAIIFPYLAPPDTPPGPREYSVNLRLLAPVVEAAKKKEPEAHEPVEESVDPPRDVVEEVVETPPTPENKPSESETTPTPSTPRIELGVGPGDAGTESSALGSRSSEAARATRIARYGGGDDTQQAVLDGLEWLANHQNKDGSWSPDNFHHHCGGQRCRGSGYPEYSVGVTALATLALLGAGEDGVRETPHKDNVRRALGYLLSVQNGNGCVGPLEGNYMYNHAIGAFCLAEAAILTADSRYQSATQRALRFSAHTQQLGGGWDYRSTRTMRNDLSVTGWQVMAIDTANRAGIPIDAKMVRRAHEFVARAVRRNGWATYADRGVGQGRGGVSMVAVGMLSKLYLGWSPTSREITRACEILVRHRPDPEARTDWKNTFQTKYYWYYATLALFHAGGDYWDAWNTYLKRHVLPLQRQSGHEKGSWDPDPNWIGAAGGRVTATALGVLMFEVYYRYDPIHEKRGSKSRKSLRR